MNCHASPQPLRAQSALSKVALKCSFPSQTTSMGKKGPFPHTKQLFSDLQLVPTVLQQSGIESRPRDNKTQSSLAATFICKKLCDSYVLSQQWRNRVSQERGTTLGGLHVISRKRNCNLAKPSHPHHLLVACLLDSMTHFRCRWESPERSPDIPVQERERMKDITM